MWNIHGKIYDLTDFASIHPGGRMIIESCKGNDDITAAFESYHALSDMNKIKSIMKKYEINGESKSDFKFDKDGFYYTLKNKVNNYFKNKNISHHSNNLWIFKSFVQFFLYLIPFSYASLCHNSNIYFRILLNLIAGHMFIQTGFGVMHDASHYAVSKHYFVNELLSKIWNGLSLWDSKIWCLHHCYKHHSYTGTNHDPDTIHFKPFIRKSTDEKSSKYMNYNHFLALFFTCIFPGMWLGQSLVYLRAKTFKKFWRMKVNDFKFSFLEILLNLFTLTGFIYSKNIFVTYSFILACNITYFLCIVPDHDTFETHQNLITNNKEYDWGELQVRNSGNFCTDNYLINYCFGGINYQIEHHLFPTISHMHFYEISKIVKKTCEDFNIPYVNQPTLYDAIKSVLHNFNEIYKKKI